MHACMVRRAAASDTKVAFSAIIVCRTQGNDEKNMREKKERKKMRIS